MPLPQINLDDRTFDQLFQELQRRIPAYTPEWTDYNDSDPGVTLMQLFAWLGEILVYRINQVPQKNFIKFLELVGISLTAPAPAVTELQFTLVTNAAATTILAGTQVALGSSSGGQQVVFETDDALLVTGLTLVSVQSYNGLQFTDYTAMNSTDASPGYLALSQIPEANAALYLGFDSAFPAGTNRLTVHTAQGHTPVPVQGGGSSASVSPPVEANWQYWNGQWTNLQIVNDTTFALTKSGYITFTAPTDGVLQQFGLLTKPTDPPLFWVRYFVQSLVGAGYENPPLLQGVLLDTVSATNSVTETGELLGASSGRPNQTFQLAFSPILPLASGVAGIIAVDEGNGYVTWKEVEDFDGYGPTDTVYTLDHSSGLVSFGDGIHGKIPLWLSGNGSNLDTADQTNVMATSYQWGGGSQANSGANTITTLLASIPNIQGVTNPLASYGGADQESVQDAEDRAPMLLRTQSRAVTIGDFAFLAAQTPGAQIARAQAFPLLNPNFRVFRSSTDGSAQVEAPIPGAVTVFVIPKSQQSPPIPSESTLQLVANYLDQHRLLTCELFVAPPNYRQVRIEVQVIAAPTYDLGTVSTSVLNQLLSYFNPLAPGGVNGQGWDFGGPIYFAETYRQIFNVPGVNLITGTLKTYVDNVLQTPCTDVQIQPDEIVYSIGHGVTVTYS
jgi:predicted phage baseplate assembly protein